jgi:alkaline phosphatase
MVLLKPLSKLKLTLAFLLIFSISCLGNDSLKFNYEQETKDVSDISFYSASTQQYSYPIISGSEVKNVILLIGDGMGLSQIRAASLRAGGF